jgi:hypothetical protein
MKTIEEDMMPFGFIQDGIEDQGEIDSEGDRWF